MSRISRRRDSVKRGPPSFLRTQVKFRGLGFDSGTNGTRMGRRVLVRTESETLMSGCSLHWRPKVYLGNVFHHSTTRLSVQVRPADGEPTH